MKLYHRTSRRAARAILLHGFRDTTNTYLTNGLHTGVWFSNEILNEDPSSQRCAVLCVDLPEEAIADYEWIEEGKPYREWLIPAAVAQASKVEEIPDEDV